MNKVEVTKKGARARSAALAEERAARLGIPRFLVRLAGWKHVKELAMPSVIRHRCD